jgi:hypothetical protein
MRKKDLAPLLPTILPLAVQWAEKQSAEIQRSGVGLSPADMELARCVGVSSPEKVRVMESPSIELPENFIVREASITAGLLGPNTLGLALGHSIFINQVRFSKRLLSHELRHVSQFEQFGSISAFLAEYLLQIVTYGYESAPLEIDARSHEVHT